MKKISTVIGLILAMMVIAFPASATSESEDGVHANAEISTRAHIVASIGDAYVEQSGISEEDLEDFFDGLPPNPFVDLAGDLNGDGVNNARDSRIRDYIHVSHAFGIVNGVDETHFEPLNDLARDQTASVFARLFNADVESGTDDVLYTDVFKGDPLVPNDGNVHGCNIHTMSDMDGDGDYNDGSNFALDPFIIHGFPPVPSLFKPNGPNGQVTNNHVHLMVDRAVQFFELDEEVERGCEQREEEENDLPELILPEALEKAAE